MKIYRANPELEKVLLENGFKEFTPNHDVRKGKKSFKLARNSSKKVKFDYINIQIHTPNGEDSRIELNEIELGIVLTCFKLNPTDLKEVLLNGKFKIRIVKERLNMLRHEMAGLNEFNINNPRRRKLKRIIDVYDSF